MQPVLLSSVSVALSLVALVFALAALGFHWIRRHEHPDVTALRLAIADTTDRVEHFMRRERVRRVREGNEAAQETSNSQPGAAARETKAELRARVFGGTR